MKDNRFDVIVIGAGPSGTVLAYELALKGIKVLLLEKDRLPREKTCAGGITLRARSLLPFDIDPVIENVIYGVRLSYNRSPVKVRTYSEPLAFMVMRDKFDYFLASRAIEACVSLLDNVKIQQIVTDSENVFVMADRGCFTGQVLVGADGANSLVVRSLGLRDTFEFGLGVNCHIAVSPDKYQEWNGLIGLDYGIPGGYAWVFPKRDCLSIGAGSSFREARRLRSYTMQLIKDYGLGPPDGLIIRGHLMPVRRPRSPLAVGRALLVGDAAGIMDPLMGEGIYYSLMSSYLAVPAVYRFLTGKAHDLQEYPEAVGRKLGPELKIARTVQKMNSVMPRLFFHYLADSDRFWRAFCRLIRGERTYASLRNSLRPPYDSLFRLF